MRKKITILALHLGYGGVEKAITSLANSLAKTNKYDIEIVSIYRLYEKPVFEVDESIKVTYLLPTKLSPNKMIIIQTHIIIIVSYIIYFLSKLIFIINKNN